MNWKGGKLKKECLICKKVLHVFPSDKKSKYCSKRCGYADKNRFKQAVQKRRLKGAYTFSKKTKLKMSRAHTGKRLSQETIQKIKGTTLGEKNAGWKGDEVGYRALHSWVVRWAGKANKCEDCGLDKLPKGKTKYFHWANISKEYKRDLSDWKQLCVKCHKEFDKII